MTATGLKKEVEKIVEDGRGAGLDIDNDVGKMIEMSATIREAIESTPMPPDLAGPITDCYRRLSDEMRVGDVACAVRSSGAVSMPGQMETYLNVKGEAGHHRPREEGLGKRLHHEGHRFQDQQ